MNPIKGISNVSYSFGERILRTAVFQIGVNGWFERSLKWIYNLFYEWTYCPKGFDLKRAEQGLKSYLNLGAQVRFITPKDGKAKIQMMNLRSSDLEKKIQGFGAKWEKIILSKPEKKSILAIIPPPIETPAWKAFEKDLFKLRWKKQTVALADQGKSMEVIVTCEDASSIQEKDWHQNLFLHSNSASVSFVMHSRRAGFYLGCKQNICFYDPRGTWKSSGVASEGGYYQDIKAVYDAVKPDFAPHRLWITAACGGCPAAAYLKAQLHAKGANLIWENGFTDLQRDFADTQGRIVRTFARHYWQGLKSKDLDGQDKPQETGFNIEKLWKSLNYTDIGKVIVVSVANDQRLSKEVTSRNVALAKSVNKHVLHIKFNSHLNDPHIDRYFNHPHSSKAALSFIFP